MTAYPQMTAQERKEEYARVLGRFEELKAQGLKLNMGPGQAREGTAGHGV